jgi:hypothetical protein
MARTVEEKNGIVLSVWKEKVSLIKIKTKTGDLVFFFKRLRRNIPVEPR